MQVKRPQLFIHTTKQTQPQIPSTTREMKETSINSTSNWAARMAEQEKA